MNALLFRWTLLVSVVGVSGAIAASAGVDSTSSESQLANDWSWRTVIEKQIKARPVTFVTPQRSPDLSPLLLHASPDTDVITLAPYRVEGHRIEAEIHRRYLIAVKQEKEEKVLRNVGTAMHTARLGPMHVGVLTVFYVPVFAGVSLSW
jgi:hypothetical protein